MKKRFWGLILAGFAAFMLIGCTYGEDNVLSSQGFDLLSELKTIKEQAAVEKNNLLIVGEGGTSGKMFIRAAETYKKEQGGVIYEVSNGDEFVQAMKDFVRDYGEIDHFEYFGHGNNVGLYVNQEPNVNGGVYVNDPDLNIDYVAASIYEVPRDSFSEHGWMRFNGCNVANGYPNEDNLAQRMANYFDADVVAPMGPTEFSKVSYTVDPIENSTFLSPDFSGDVYMVPTYSDQGFMVVKPQSVGASAFVDVREGQGFYEAVQGMYALGLSLGWEAEELEKEFFPYKNISYKEAVEFCKTVFGRVAECSVSGYAESDKIRNLHALKMLVDAYGAEVSYTNPWSDAYIWWANQQELLTKDFVNKKWYTRAEMAELAWGFTQL